MRSARMGEWWSVWVAIMIGAAALLLMGCVPGSVEPLLEQVEVAIERERGLLAEDAEREAARHERDRVGLARAFEADLAGRQALDAEWVRRGVTAYVAAREAVLASQLSAAQRYERRRENLAAARDAQRRAIALLERYDQLVDWVPGLPGVSDFFNENLPGVLDGGDGGDGGEAIGPMKGGQR